MVHEDNDEDSVDNKVEFKVAAEFNIENQDNKDTLYDTILSYFNI